MANEQSADQPETERDVREEARDEEQEQAGATEASAQTGGAGSCASADTPDDPQAEIESLRAEL